MASKKVIARILSLFPGYDKDPKPGSPEYWDKKYELELQGESFRKHWQERDIRFLEDEVLDRYPSGPLNILCPGCGISVVPKILHLYGHRVIACDHSQVAIDFAKSHTLALEEVAAHYRLVVDDVPKSEGLSNWSAHFEEDFGARLAALRKRIRSGGSLEFRVCDWLSVPEQDFDLIYCEHAFKQADKKLVRKSIQRFASQLKNTGLLLATEINDQNFIGYPIARELGFLVDVWGPCIGPSDNVAVPPAQKSAIFLYCTG